MRLFEFTDDGLNSGLSTVLSFLAQRAADSGAPGTMSTQAVINQVSNSGSYFDYAALANAYENDPTVKNLIKSFDKDKIVLRLPGDDEPTSADEDNGDDESDVDDSHGDENVSFDDIDNEAQQDQEEEQEQRDPVGDMAKRAMHRSPNLK